MLDATPLVGTLGRACYAPCEVDCTRGSLEGPLPIRRLKRFIADEHYDHFDGPGVEIPEPNGHRVAIVGSGPAGLTAAWQLARKGYEVKVFEAAPKAGGFLRLAIPAYRLPSEVVERDIANVTALGVEIAVNSPVEDLSGLRDDGYDAVLVATGTPLSTRMGVPGDQLDGVLSGVAFLRAVKLGEGVDLGDKRVVVIGGGNVAMDTARTARRLGARDVTVVYRRTRAEMPAHHVEADDTEKEGVGFVFQAAPVAVLDDGHGATRGLRCSRMTQGTPDASGRSRPEPVQGSDFDIDCDVIISAIGMAPDTAAFAGQVRTSPNGSVVVDERTLQTDVPWLFAAGDVVSGASDITRATGQGQRAAFMIDRWIQDRTLEGFDLRLPVVDKDEVLARQKAYRLALPAAPSEIVSAAPIDFREVEQPMTEAEAALRRRALPGLWRLLGMRRVRRRVSGRRLHRPPRAGQGRWMSRWARSSWRPASSCSPPTSSRNTASGRSRTSSPACRWTACSPRRGRSTRSSGRATARCPERIAYVMCTGSRDETVGNPLCSRFCCMYSIKQNQLIMGALPHRRRDRPLHGYPGLRQAL